LRFDTTGRFLFVREPWNGVFANDSAAILRVDTRTAARQPWLSLQPTDRVGLGRIDAVRLSADGQSYTYTYRRDVSNPVSGGRPSVDLNPTTTRTVRFLSRAGFYASARSNKVRRASKAGIVSVTAFAIGATPDQGSGGTRCARDDEDVQPHSTASAQRGRGCTRIVELGADYATGTHDERANAGRDKRIGTCHNPRHKSGSRAAACSIFRVKSQDTIDSPGSLLFGLGFFEQKTSAVGAVETVL
jgi:hypothetical protein